MMQSVKGRTPLQPKRLNPNTGVRLQLKAHGYDIIPLNINKIPFKGWPAQPNDEPAIRKWGGVATGLRMKGHDIFVLDIDVRIEAVRDDILAAWTERWPEFMAGCLRGDGNGSSEPRGQSRTTRSATPRAPPPVGAIDAACPQSDRRYRQ